MFSFNLEIWVSLVMFKGIFGDSSYAKFYHLASNSKFIFIFGDMSSIWDDH